MRIRTLITIVCLLASAAVYAATTYTAIEDGRTWSFTLDSSGNAILTGVDDASGELTLPARLGTTNVVAVGNRAFQSLSGLVKLTVPGAVKSIGYAAFADSAIQELVLEEGVQTLNGDASIEMGAFRSCDSLTNIVFATTVTNIGSYCFEYCSALAHLDLPVRLEELGPMSFAHTEALRGRLVLPDSLSCANGGIFMDSGIDELVMGNGVRYTYGVTYNRGRGHTGAFSNCSHLTNIVFGTDLTEIGYRGFSGCGALRKVRLPDSLRTIGAGAFMGSGLESLELGDGVTEIEDGYKAARDTSYPFGLCDSLTNVVLGSSLRVIGNWSFATCDALTEITLPDSVQSIGGGAFAWTPLRNLVLGKGTVSIASNSTDAAFEYCEKLTNVVLNSGLEYLGPSFWRCTSLRHVTIPDSVVSIGRLAFYGATSLERVTLGSGLTTLGEGVLADCPKLVEVHCRAPAAPVQMSLFLSGDSAITYIYLPDDATGWSDDGTFPDLWQQFRVKPESQYDPDAGIRHDLAFYRPEDWPARVFFTGESGGTTAEMPLLAGDDVYLRYACWDSWMDEALVSPFTNSVRITAVSNGTSRVLGTFTDGMPGGLALNGTALRNYALGSFEPGTYRLDVKLDVGGRLTETCLDNNATSIVFTVAPSIAMTFKSEGSVITVKRYGSGGVYGSLPNAPLRSGYAFLGWYTDLEGGERVQTDSTVPLQAGTLYAHWEVSEPQTLYVSSGISSNTTLRSGNTYLVRSSVAVGSGATLTIEPGAVVKFNAGCRLLVNSGATLVAEGLLSAPIVFTSCNDDEHGEKTSWSTSVPQPGDWNQIMNYGTIRMDYCQVLWCSSVNNQGGLFQEGGSWTFADSIVAHCRYDNVRVKGGDFTAENALFLDGPLGAAPAGGTSHFVNCVFNDLTTAVRWKYGSFVNCVFSDITQDIIDSDSNTSDCVFSHCVFWNPSGTGDHAAGKAGENGCVYADPRFTDASGWDFTVAADSPCVDAADDEQAPAADYYGQPRVGVADIGVSERMLRGQTAGVDLVALDITAESQIEPGQQLLLQWVVANRGSSKVQGEWSDTLSLVSADGTREVTLGDTISTLYIAAGGENVASVRLTVPPLSEGTWYPKVNVNSRHDIYEGGLTTNNVLTGGQAVVVTVPRADAAEGRIEGRVLAGVPGALKLSFAEADTNRMVRLILPAGVTVRWGFGFMPDDGYSSGSADTDGTDVLFRVPEGSVDVYLSMSSGTAADYALATESARIAITGVSPATVPYSGEVTLVIDGAGFTANSTVGLVCGGARTAPVSVRSVNDRRLAATVDCAALQAGEWYDVEVSDALGIARTERAFEVDSQPGAGEFWFNLEVPDAVREGRVITCSIEYGNRGTADIPAQIVQVSIEGGGRVSLDGKRYRSELQFVAASSGAVAGVLRPGEEFVRHFKLLAGDDNVITSPSSWGHDYCPEGWPSSSAYIQDISRAATRLGNRGEDPYDFDTVLCLARMTLETNAVCAIAGRICDRCGIGIAGAGVSISNRYEGVWSAYADDEGGFIFNELVPDVYYLYTDTATEIRDVLSLEDVYSDRCGLEYTLDLDRGIDVTIAADEQDASLRVTAMRIDTNGEETVISAVRKSAEVFNIGCDRSGFYTITGDSDTRHGATLVRYVTGLTNAVLRLAETFSVSGRVENVISPDTQTLMAIGKYHVAKESLDADGAFAFSALPQDDYVFRLLGDEAESYEAVSCTRDELLLGNEVVLQRSVESRARLMARSVRMTGEYDKYHFYEVRQVARQLLEEALVLYEHKTVPYPALDCSENLYVYRTYCQKRNDFLWWMHHYRDQVVRYSGTSGADMAKECAYLIAEIGAAVADIGTGTGRCQSLVAETENLLDSAADADSAVSMVTYAAVVESVDNATAAAREAVTTLDAMSDSDSVLAWGDGVAILLNDASTIYSAYERMRDYAGILRRMSAFSNAAARLVTIADELEALHSQTLGYVDKIRNLLSLYARAREAASKILSYAFEISALREAANFFRTKYDAYYSLRFNGYHERCDDPVPNPPYDVVPRRRLKRPRSCDPNEITGPTGSGNADTERFVKPGTWMTYTVYYENVSNATAAAESVAVVNPLSPYLDWSTFEMGEVSFGNQIDLGLSGLQSGTSEVQMDGTNYLVRTQVTLDREKGAVSWYQRVVDKTTETTWPDDPYAGFLPPNDDAHRGEGHLTYRVKVREDAPIGVRIDNAATIVFDYNDPITTDPSWWNTVGEIQYEVGFAADALTVDEGGALALEVSGGSDEAASSVQVYLTYQTASAADLDLKGIRFPLTLGWEAGEVGTKTITIPVKTDRTLEPDETLVFQLANAEGQELGECAMCTVTIHDTGYDPAKAPALAPYAAGLAEPANAGRVTGCGRRAAGRKTTLRAVANRGYVFKEWSHGDGASSYTFTMPETNVTYLAKFITAAEDRAAISASVNGIALEPWVSKSEPHAYATNIWTGVYLEWPVAAEALSATTVKVAGLPAGLRYDTKKGLIAGAPTMPSKTGRPSQVKVTVTTTGKSSQVYEIDATVDPLPDWATGTFEGFSYADGPETNGLASVTIGANGRISAKQPVEGRTAHFAADYFDRYDADNAAFFATLTAKRGRTVLTNALAVTEAGIEADRFDTFRYSWRTEPWKSLAKTVDWKAATQAYETEGGTVTLRFTSFGRVMITGVFSKVRETATANLVPSGDHYVVFVYLAPKGLPPHARCVEVEL